MAKAKKKKALTHVEIAGVKAKIIPDMVSLIKHEKKGLHGLYIMPENVYFAAKGVSQSMLKEWIANPRLYRYKRIHRKRIKEKEAFRFGKLLERFAFDREAFKQQYYVAPNKILKHYKTVDSKWVNVKRGQDSWRQLEKENPNKIVIARSEFRRAVACKMNIFRHENTDEIIGDGGHWQVCAFWESQGILCKGRTDYIATNGRHVADTKHTSRIGAKSFQFDIRDFGYDCQGGWYLPGFANFLPNLEAFYLGVVESAPPYEMRWYVFRDEDVQKGGDYLRGHLAAFVEADYGMKPPPMTGKLFARVPERYEFAFEEEF